MIDQIVTIYPSIEEPVEDQAPKAIFKFEDGFVDVVSIDQDFGDEWVEYFQTSETWAGRHVHSENPFGQVFKSGYQAVVIQNLDEEGLERYNEVVLNLTKAGDVFEGTVAPTWEDHEGQTDDEPEEDELEDGEGESGDPSDSEVG